MKKTGTGTLTGKLKNTVLLLSAGMIAMWIFFYVSINKLIDYYTLSNMERAVESGISQINTSFLQMERLYFAMSGDEKIAEVFEKNDCLSFHNAAAAAEERLGELTRAKSFLSGMILYNDKGFFYRLHGKLSNTGVERLLYLVNSMDDDYICAKLDNENCIGYITRLENGRGGFVMLIKEADIQRLFGSAKESGLSFALSAGDGEIAVTSDDIKASTLADFKKNADHIKSEQIGSTPFRLWASYTDKGGRAHFLFMAAMALMALLLLFLMQVFLYFWRKNFFTPIQTVINEVESFDGVKGKLLPLTGMEHFDGLIRGINEMAERIEAKDKALVISLKKQINAHFTFNILNIIKALSEKGESRKAGELCAGLSLLLRYANGGENFISGMDEFFVLQNYVDIMAIRYPNRFSAEIEVEDFLDDIKLPRMLLQPVVENSIVHGLIGGGRSGTVRIYALDEGGRVSFIVEDDGCGMSPERLEQLRAELDEAPFSEPESDGLTNIALTNIERRIKFYFGKEYGLTVSSEENAGTKVTVILPKIS